MSKASMSTSRFYLKQNTSRSRAGHLAAPDLERGSRNPAVGSRNLSRVHALEKVVPPRYFRLYAKRGCSPAHQQWACQQRLASFAISTRSSTGCRPRVSGTPLSASVADRFGPLSSPCYPGAVSGRPGEPRQCNLLGRLPGNWPSTLSAYFVM
jgi:hypothetical protein